MQSISSVQATIKPAAEGLSCMLWRDGTNQRHTVLRPQRQLELPADSVRALSFQDNRFSTAGLHIHWKITEGVSSRRLLGLCYELQPGSGSPYELLPILQ